MNINDNGNSSIVLNQIIKVIFIYFIRAIKVSFLTPLILIYFFLGFMYFCIALLGLSKVGIVPTYEMVNVIFSFFSSGKADYVMSHLISWGLTFSTIFSIALTIYRTVTKKKRVLRNSLIKSSIYIIVLWSVGIFTFLFLSFENTTVSTAIGFFFGIVIPNIFLNCIYLMIDYFSDIFIESLNPPQETELKV